MIKILINGLGVFSFLCLSFCEFSISEAALLPSDRRISWRPGIAGGIPSYPVGVNAADYGANGNDALDDTAAIQNAINACGAEKAVYIPEGTYYINSLVLQNRRIVLRGAGPTKTVLRSNAGNHAIRIIGASAERGPISISSGAEKGSATVRVSNTSGVTVGEIWSIYPNAAMPVESTSGVNSNCEWYDNFGQLVKIASKTSSSVTFSPALYYDISGYEPQMKKRGNYTSRCGIEDLKVEFTNRVSGTYTIFMYLADECWVKNVESNNTNYAHVYLRYSKSCEVRDSYFHHAHEYVGGWAYGVFIADINSDHLVENNIFNHCRHSMIFEGGGSGCVFGYNYSVDPQGRSSVGTPNNWLYSDISTHGRHPYMNLWEGNIAAHASLDNFHGSSSHNTLFRNWILGKATNTDNPNGVTNGRNVVEVMKNNTYENFIGNILGYSGCGADGYRYEQYPLVAYDRNVWVIGYTQDNPSGTRDTIPGETIIRQGNYDYVRNVVEWAPSIQDRSIPQSLYLSSKPQFFGNLPWPSIGPDLDPVAGDIPAKRRFEEMQSHLGVRMPE